MENKIYQHSYNLIQNFYIIGITKKNNTLVSKILSRFPQVELPYMNVDDEIIINVRKKFLLFINILLLQYIALFSKWNLYKRRTFSRRSIFFRISK